VKARLLAITVAVLVFVPTALSATYAGGHVKKASAGTTIVVYASGDVNVQNLWQSNIIPNFEKRNKGLYVKFIFSEHGTDDGTTLARIGAAVKGRHWPGIDLVDGGLVTTMAAAGLNQPVAKATAPNLKRVNKDLLAPVKGAAIPYRGSSVVLAYNTDKV
jgi:putative spermidine/putrescine transport system substrate-binding protein